MDVNRLMIHGPEQDVPSVIFTPPKPVGAAVIVHGYGGCKEEQLGLAWRVAERGIATCAIDLRGHGEHPLALDENVLSDVEVAVHFCRRYGKVVAIGHSLGGRLSLISDADHSIGISPPLDPTYSAKTQELLRKLRSYRVRPDDHTTVFDLLQNMPLWRPNDVREAMLIYGSRDVPEIVSSCRELGSKGVNAVEIANAFHGDIFNMEATFDTVVGQLEHWFCER